MTVTITHVLVGIAISVAVLLLTLYLVWRNTRTVYPVRCVHCWVRNSRENVVSYSSSRDQWAICPDCVRFYWVVDTPVAPADGKPAPPVAVTSGMDAMGGA
jgi:hypothetical protein